MVGSLGCGVDRCLDILIRLLQAGTEGAVRIVEQGVLRIYTGFLLRRGYAVVRGGSNRGQQVGHCGIEGTLGCLQVRFRRARKQRIVVNGRVGGVGGFLRLFDAVRVFLDGRGFGPRDDPVGEGFVGEVLQRGNVALGIFGYLFYGLDSLLCLLDLRLHILFGRDIPRGGLVAFRQLNVVQVDRVPGNYIENYFLQGLARLGRIDRFIQLGCGRRRRRRHVLVGVVVIDRTEYYSTRTVGLLDTGLEDIGHAGLVSDLTAETILPGCDLIGGCGRYAGIRRFTGVDGKVCSVCVRTGRHHIRNALFDTVPRIEELSGDVVTGSELKIFDLVFGFLGRLIDLFDVELLLELSRRGVVELALLPACLRGEGHADAVVADHSEQLAPGVQQRLLVQAADHTLQVDIIQIGRIARHLDSEDGEVRKVAELRGDIPGRELPVADIAKITLVGARRVARALPGGIRE